VTKPWPDPLYAYLLPTYPQAKKVAWKKIKQLIPNKWGCKINESELSITSPQGVTLYCVGMDKPERIEGLQFDGVVIDEACDHKSTVWGRTVRPALTHRKGWCYMIGVPKRHGPGASMFKEFIRKGERGQRNYETYAWASDTVLDSQEIADARADLSEADFNEQMKAAWLDSSGGCYDSFSEKFNVSDKAQYRPEEDIAVCSDFNVDPMAWVLAHKIGNELHVFDEIYMRNTNTQKTLNHLWSEYGNQHKGGWFFFGDASGRARHSSANDSDYLQIYNDTRFGEKVIRYPKANPAIKDRYSAVNAMLSNADGLRRMFINPRCKNLIRDIQQRSFKPGTTDPDNSDPEAGHITDALGYGVWQMFPLRARDYDDYKVNAVSIQQW
jgi:hypothetical protein